MPDTQSKTNKSEKKLGIMEPGSGRAHRDGISNLGDDVLDQGRGSLVVLVTGDALGVLPELPDLLKHSGLKARIVTEIGDFNVSGDSNPDLVVANFSRVRDARAERVEALKLKYGCPLVCLLPYPAERDIAQASFIRADGIIFKPLSRQEFRCRVQMLLCMKHNRHLEPDDDAPKVCRCRSFLCIKGQDSALTPAVEQSHLTRKEHDLLILLASDPGRVFSVDEIIRWVWKGKRRIMASDVHQCVYALRKKIERDPHHPRCVLTVPRFGYRLARCTAV